MSEISGTHALSSLYPVVNYSDDRALSQWSPSMTESPVHAWKDGADFDSVDRGE